MTAKKAEEKGAAPPSLFGLALCLVLQNAGLQDCRIADTRVPILSLRVGLAEDLEMKIGIVKAKT